MTSAFRRLQEKRRDGEEGFTLIELLVVIIIIGILAAIAIPVYLNQRQKAYLASVKSDLQAYATTEESYFTDNNTYGGIALMNAAGAKLSPGNTITLLNAVGSTSYCLRASNANGATADTWYFASANGGLTSVACT